MPLKTNKLNTPINTHWKPNILNSRPFGSWIRCWSNEMSPTELNFFTKLHSSSIRTRIFIWASASYSARLHFVHWLPLMKNTITMFLRTQIYGDIHFIWKIEPKYPDQYKVFPSGGFLPQLYVKTEMVKNCIVNIISHCFKYRGMCNYKSRKVNQIPLKKAFHLSNSTCHNGTRKNKINR